MLRSGQSPSASISADPVETDSPVLERSSISAPATVSIDEIRRSLTEGESFVLSEPDEERTPATSTTPGVHEFLSRQTLYAGRDMSVLEVIREIAGTESEAGKRARMLLTDLAEIEETKAGTGLKENYYLIMGMISTLDESGDKGVDQVIGSLLKDASYREVTADALMSSPRLSEHAGALSDFAIDIVDVEPSGQFRTFALPAILSKAITNSNNEDLREKVGTAIAGYVLNRNQRAETRERAVQALNDLYSNDPKRLVEKVDAMLAEEMPAERREDLTALKTAYEMGILFPNRLGLDTATITEALDRQFNNRHRAEDDTRPLAVVAASRYDHNGVFAKLHSNISTLEDAGYRVVYLEANTDKELVADMRKIVGPGSEQEQKASVLLLAAHGSNSTMQLSYTQKQASAASSVGLDDKALLSDPESGMSECLAKNGQVILFSCSTGAGREQFGNIANMFREVFPQAREDGIFAPTRETNLLQFTCDPDDGSISSLRFNNSELYRTQREEPPSDRLRIDSALDSERFL